MQQGTITAVGQYGFKLSSAKAAPWYNWANEWEGRRDFAKGEHVEFDVNAKGYVVAIRALDRPVGAEPRAHLQAAPAMTFGDRDLYIARESAIKSAIEMLHAHGAWLEANAADKVSSVLTVAGAFESYIRGETEPEQVSW